MSEKTMKDAFIDELRDAYDGEKQLIKALPKLAKAATSPQLSEAFRLHLEETKGQVVRLEKCFELLGEKVRGKHCDGIAGIVEEGKSIMEEDFGPELMDAALVSGAQRAEHYEMASYGSLIAWARTLGHTHVAQILKETLDEEEAADKKLSTLAEGGINRAAAEAKPSEKAPARKKKAAKRKAPKKAARKAPARKAGARKMGAKGAKKSGTRKAAKRRK